MRHSGGVPFAVPPARAPNLLTVVEKAEKSPPRVQMTLEQPQWWEVQDHDRTPCAVRVRWWGEPPPGRRVALRTSLLQKGREQDATQSARQALLVRHATCICCTSGVRHTTDCAQQVSIKGLQVLLHMLPPLYWVNPPAFCVALHVGATFDTTGWQ